MIASPDWVRQSSQGEAALGWFVAASFGAEKACRCAALRLRLSAFSNREENRLAAELILSFQSDRDFN